VRFYVDGPLNIVHIEDMETAKATTGDTDMAYFNAKHDNGTEWKLCVPSHNKKLTQDDITKRAKLFVRNYCLKNGLKDGGATITAEDGSTFRMEGLYA